jgi:malonyl-CoA/methylmalonyl-CoA synthetase
MNAFLTLVGPAPVEPARPFLRVPAGAALSYGDLFAVSAQMAQALVGLGVRPGDRVAVQTDKSPEALLLYLACLRAGAVYLPLNPAYTLAEVEYYLADAEPALVIGRPETTAHLRDLAARLRVGPVHSLGTQGDGSFMELVRGASGDFTDVVRDKDDLAALLYTSGTTGRSKGAMLTHENLASNAQALVETWRFTADDVLIHALPIFHVHGLFVATNVVLLARASMIYLQKFDAAAILREMPGATSLMGVPTFYVRLLEEPGLTRETAAHMRLFVSGSAPLLAETHAAFRAKTGHAILERYGMTETGMITSNPYDGPRVAGTVGTPLPRVELRIVDPESGAELPAGEIGIIEVRGPNVFKGYWRMPEKTAAEIRPDGFFITGDVGRIEQHGYVQIVGRAKDLVISGGFNVYPKEVESEIDAIAGVVESAVIGVPHPDFGEGVTAVVVLQKGAALGEADLLGRLESRLAKYKLPKRIFFVAELPRNTMGKVQKNLLREAHRGIYEG